MISSWSSSVPKSPIYSRPGILLALIGLVWFHKGPVFPVEFVTTLVLTIAMPAFLFHTLATSVVPIASLGEMAVATLLVHLVLTTAAILVLRLASKDWRLSVGHVVGNTGNLGLPICYFAFGDQGLAYAMTFFSVQCVLLFSLGDCVYAGVVTYRKLFQSPVLHAIWLGVMVSYLDVPLPALILSSAQLLGQLVIPIMLITLGVSLAGMRASQLQSTVLWSTIRTLLAVSVGFGVAHVLDLQGVARGVLIIQTVVPVAVFNYLLALKHGHDATELSGMILITHLAAVFYLPIVLSIVL